MVLVYPVMVEEFQRLAPTVPRLVSVILFGSHARGEADLASDIDLLFVYDMPRRPTGTREQAACFRAMAELRAALERRFASRVNIDHIHSRLKDLEKGFLKEIGADAKLVWGRGIIVEKEHLALDPYTLIYFDVSKLKQGRKTVVAQMLYGRKERKIVGGKRKEYITKGLIEETRGVKLGKGAVLVRAEHAHAIAAGLERLGASAKRIEVWM